MRAVAGFVTGRRTKWLVLLAWVVLAVALRPIGGKLADVTDDRTESALPEHAESTEVIRTLEREFPGGQTANGLIVYRRPGGLTDADRARIVRDARRAARELPLVGPPVLPFSRVARRTQVSRDRELAYAVVALPNDEDRLPDWGKTLREITGDGAGTLDVYVTGDAGFSADFDEVFASFDTKLLTVTVALVLVLLLLIYRSPAIALLPLIVVGLAYTVAQGFVYLLAKSGETVSSNTTTILVVLMFGVGTDYCLLLVSRYREELRRKDDKHDAMAQALRRAGPAILASGLTVSLTMLVLLLADVGTIRSLGPASAIGVGCAFVAGLTALPALLAIVGRRGFWPRSRLVAFDPEAVEYEHPGVWRRFGDRVLERPVAALGVTLALFAIGGLGLLAYKESYSTTGVFKKDTESVDGFRAIERSFPAGALAPADVLVERSNGPVRPADVARAQARLASAAGVAAITPGVQRSRDGRIARFALVLSDDPYTPRAFNRVPALRERISDLGPGVRGLIGGGSATQYDYNEANARDVRVIVPTSLLVIAVILGVLLQAVVAPLVLIASVVVSFFGTLGLGVLFFLHVVGEDGVDNSLPIFAFIFLVALGIDYTIFLMSRVREEARRHGTREGMLRALGATGPVITSAGIILAGTFSVLMTLPVWFIFNIGFLVALGILLDTFIVRTIMVPAAVELLGDRTWWPSTSKGGLGAFKEPQAEREAVAEGERAGVR
ncbi:MAG: MMPL family transporter [Nocardioidaceae bacterium]